jgi:type I restriction enzyme S subunit
MGDVPEGYRMSEVGVIPEKWEVISFGDNLNIISGFGFNKSEYVGYGIKLLRIDNVSYGEITWESMAFLPIKYRNKHPNLIIYIDDILLALNRPITNGKLKIAIVQPKDTPCILYQRVGKIIILNNSYNKIFAYYLLSKFIKKFVEESSVGSDQPFISTVNLKKIKIPLPPPLEQQAIASALNDVDALITALEQLITKKRNIKQGAMQQLLTGEKRLPGFDGEWEVKKLGEIADIISGGTPSTNISEFWNGDIKWCTPTDITRTKQKYLLQTEKNISEKGLRNSSATLLPVGALLLCSRATIGEIRIAKDVVCTNQGFKSLVCKKSFDNQFVYYLLLQSKQKLINKAIGSTFLEISKKDTDAIEFIFPSFPEQQVIAQILSDIDTEIESLVQKRNKYKAIKQGMMQELLTGKTRFL